MSKDSVFGSSELARIFSGNPVFNGPVYINSNLHGGGDRGATPELIDEFAGNKVEDEVDANVEECSPGYYEDHWGKSDIYPIKAHPKGRILIINNEFKDSKMRRNNCQQDVANMMVLWQSMGFAIEIISDLTADGMLQAVQEFVNSDSMKRADICAIMVMSHGQKDDFIVGERHTTTNVMNIVDQVKQSTALRRKPKLLFFQMCRGAKAEKYRPKSTFPSRTQHDSAVEADSRPITDEKPESDSIWLRSLLDNLLPKKDQNTQHKQVRQRVRQLEVDSPGQTESDSVPFRPTRRVENDAYATEYTDHGGNDIMIAFSTQPDHVAFRGDNGSWFITAIKNQFKMHAKDHDLMRLMDLVKDEVCKKRSRAPSKQKYDDCVAAVEASDSFMGKRLFFFPGFPNTAM